ncbi:cytidylate kinase [Buchnera aphidicola (Rhopalosiphum maidis)]|uniref:(d)CMP kinase n=1 Tax=Buchnera aphidicola subsp. Rhopalosiphum maidis TaxID=118109 RepID=A0A3G2I5Q7_BUCRM|nr:cytidylate kinase [Buchnera aphidicola (Rhopalosiphum maidis)]
MKLLLFVINRRSGVSKSSLFKIIAQKLNWSLLESSKIYRLIVFFILNIPILEEKIIPFLKNLDFFSKKKS